MKGKLRETQKFIFSENVSTYYEPEIQKYSTALRDTGTKMQTGRQRWRVEGEGVMEGREAQAGLSSPWGQGPGLTGSLRHSKHCQARARGGLQCVKQGTRLSQRDANKTDRERQEKWGGFEDPLFFLSPW